VCDSLTARLRLPDVGPDWAFLAGVLMRRSGIAVSARLAALGLIAPIWAVQIAASPPASAQLAPTPQPTLTPPAAASPAAPLLEVRIADNVFVIPDKTAKAVTGWLIVKAGCADEEGDCTGIAHYLEHLLFINRDSDHKSKVSAFPGGSGNGWTTMKTTAYIQKFPSNPATDAAQLDKLVAYLSGMLVDVKSDPDQAERERNIVLQEHLLNHGRNAFRRFGMTLNRTLMPDEPLGQRVGGVPETIKAYTAEAAVKFHKQWYARNNAILVLHGPVDPEAVKPLVAKHFLALPERPVPTRVWTTQKVYEPSSKLVTATEADAKQVGVYVNRLVNFDEPMNNSERRPLNAARGLIGSFLGSKLPGSPIDVLQEEQGLITSGALSVSKVRAGTLQVSFWGVPATGVAPEAVVEAAKAYIDKLPALVIPDATLERLQRRRATSRDLRLQQPDKHAEALVNWFSGHDTYDYWLELDKVSASVTPDHVRAVLAAMGKPGREVIGIIKPKNPVADATAPLGAPAGIADPAVPPQ
jgi:zinc protease